MKTMPSLSVLVALGVILPSFGAVQARAGYQSEVLTDAPLVYYRFDETSGFTALNKGSLGNAADGTYAETGVLLGEVAAVPGLGTAVSLDGSTSYVVVPALAIQPLPKVTIEMWTKGTVENTALAALYANDSWEGGGLHLNEVDVGPLLEFAVNGNGPAPGANYYPRISLPWALEEWHFLAVVYDTQATGQQVAVYLDGILRAKLDTGPGNTPLGFKSGRIGAWNDTRPFAGVIDEFAIYPTALSQARIQAHYYVAKPEAIIAVSPVDATVLEGKSASFSVTAGGPNLAYQWLRNGEVIPGATNAIYTTAPTSASDNGANFSVRVSNPANSLTSSDAVLTVVTKPTGDYASTVLADSPILYYRFNETSGLTAGNQGTLGSAGNGDFSSSGATLGAASASAGLGAALDLNGGYVHVPDLATGPLGTVSMEMWINRRNNPVDFSSLYATAWQTEGLHLNLVGAGPLVEVAVNGNPSHPRFAPPWPLGEWHHLVITYEVQETATIAKAYLDGAMVGQGTAGTTGINFTDAQIGAWLNHFEDPPAQQRFLNGQIDEFALYSTVLSPAQVLRHYVAAAPEQPPYAKSVLGDSPLVYYRFNETNGTVVENLGTLGAIGNATYGAGGVALAQPPAFPGMGTAIALDGASGSVGVPNLTTANLTNLTIEMWLNRKVDGSSLTALYANDGYAGGALHLNLFAEGGKQLLEYAVSGNPATVRFAPVWSTNEWHYVAVTYAIQGAGSQVSFYLDGALFAQSAAGATAVNLTGSQIGAWLNTFASPPVSQRFLNGLVDEFAIYPKALSAAQILARYSTLPTQVAIVGQPADVAALVGQTVSFNVVVTGGNVSFQWLKGGQAIAGATNATYTIPPATMADNGAVFSVRVSNPVNTVTSSNAVLTVVGKPTGDYASNVLADSPLVYYQFSETSGLTVANSGSLGNGADGFLSEGGATLGQDSAVAALGKAIGFDGASGFVTVPDLSILGIEPLEKTTIEMWLKRTFDRTDLAAMYANDAWESGALHLNQTGTGPRLEFAVNGTGPSPMGPYYAQASLPWPINEWHYFVASYDTQAIGQQATIYLDGVPRAKLDMGAGIIGMNFHAGQIAAWTSSRYFTGDIDEFAIYPTNLNAAQVLRHYAAAVPPVEAPVLSFSRSGIQLTLSWTVTGFTLQENASVANPAGWTDVAGGSTSPVIVNLGNGAKFYRLKK